VIKNFKSSKKKEDSYLLGKPHKAISRFFNRNFASQKWHDLFRVLNRKNLQPRILYPARRSFRIEGEIVSQTNRN